MVNISQEKARFIFEELTGLTFRLTRKELDGKLELDGYCEELKIAFEYNGEQHYDIEHYYNKLQQKYGYDSQITRDQRKRVLCLKKGITLIEIRHTKDTDYLENYIRLSLSELGVNLNNKVSWKGFKKTVDALSKTVVMLKKKSIKLLTKAYLGSHSRHKYKCIKCSYIWESVLKDVLYKSGCPMCAGMLKHSIDDIRKISKQSGLILLSSVYTSMRKKHKFKCIKCSHIWHAKPNNIQQGRGCPKCSGNIGINFEDFSRCIKNKQIRIIGTFTGIKKSYKFICNVCNHTWATVASNIWHKTGCPSCSIDKKRINIDNLKLLASKRNLKLLSKQCKGYNVIHDWMCVNCESQCGLKPCNVQRGTSCRKCKMREKKCL